MQTHANTRTHKCTDVIWGVLARTSSQDPKPCSVGIWIRNQIRIQMRIRIYDFTLGASNLDPGSRAGAWTSNPELDSDPDSGQRWRLVLGRRIRIQIRIWIQILALALGTSNPDLEMDSDPDLDPDSLAGAWDLESRSGTGSRYLDLKLDFWSHAWELEARSGTGSRSRSETGFLVSESRI